MLVKFYLEFFQNKELNSRVSKGKSSFDKAMYPVHFLAHLKNLKCISEKLSQDHEDSACEYCKTGIDAEFLQLMEPLQGCTASSHHWSIIFLISLSSIYLSIYTYNKIVCMSACL